MLVHGPDQQEYACCARDTRVCEIGWAGQPWARNPKTPHFYWLGLGRPGPPQPLTFIDRAWAGPARLPNPSLLSTGPSSQPLTSVGQTPHISLPGQAAPCRTVSDRVGPCRHRVGPCRGPCRRVGLTLAHPCNGICRETPRYHVGATFDASLQLAGDESLNSMAC